MPLGFFFAGTLTKLTFRSPGSVTEPSPFLCMLARMVASYEAMTARTALTSIAASSAKWESRLVRLNAVSILADAALDLQVKCSTKDTESQRIATAKIEWAGGKLADLRRSEVEDRDSRKPASPSDNCQHEHETAPPVRFGPPTAALRPD
jgi:hypothetical protein